jgi:hypothetical protein
MMAKMIIMILFCIKFVVLLISARGSREIHGLSFPIDFGPGLWLFIMKNKKRFSRKDAKSQRKDKPHKIVGFKKRAKNGT